ncbi:MAG TPA: DUF4386 domain-containing protein [Chthoniobacterales bacterium]|nr:DUF4386 domain-containing protein [Chthoniobacterales bacterium]
MSAIDLPNESVRFPALEPGQHRAARIAGISYLLSTIIVVFANYGLLNPLIAAGDATRTAQNILAHELQFRIGLTGFVLYSIVTVVLLVALYVVLKPVNRTLALIGALFRLVFAMLWLLAGLNLLGTLRLLGSAKYLQVFEPERLHTLARFYLASTFDDYYVGLPFFGLAATICAYLWLKSKYIPGWLAWFGVISSAWCVICAFAYLLIPRFGKTVNPYWFDSPMALFEIVVSIWLLARGLTPPPQIAAMAHDE